MINRVLSSLLRFYLHRFPLEFGKWRLWTLVHPRMQKTCFDPGVYFTKFGFRMRLDPAQYIDKFIYFWGVWEPDETYVIRKLLKPGDIFVDVGANAGFFSLIAAGIVGVTGHVHSIEAVPTTVKRLKENLILNSATNATVHECAALDKPATVKIAKHGVDDISGLNSIRSPRVDRGHWEVRGVRIDDIINTAQPIQLIKIDIEGAEMLALQGLSTHLHSEVAPVILCEVTDSFLKELGSSASDLYRYMESSGYAYAYDCHNRKMTLLPPQDSDTDTFQRNVVFSKTPLSFTLS